MKQTVNFKDLKAKVGVDDIAYYLGYRLDRSAGVGRYIEMVLPDTTGHKDKLIIKNPKEKAAQTYFRRNGAKGGDVVSLIRENLNSFHESGKNEWEIIGKVMARFANEPIPDYGDSQYLAKAGYTGNTVFDPKRYETKDIDGAPCIRTCKDQSVIIGTALTSQGEQSVKDFPTLLGVVLLCLRFALLLVIIFKTFIFFLTH